MAIATGFTAERMLEIENETVVSGVIDENYHLILTTREGLTIDAGYVRGAPGSDATVPDATTTVKGKLELASSLEVQLGLSTNKAVTPSTLSARTANEARTGLVERASQAEVDGGTDATRFISPKTLHDSLELPLPWVGNGSVSTVISSTAWASIPGNLRATFPAYDRDVLVEASFGALGLTSAGYWMVGVSIFDDNGGTTWSILPERGDPGIGGDPDVSYYGLYAPFAQSTQQVQLHGIKRLVIPAGTPSVFQMAMRKSTSSVTSMNYTSMEINFLRWL